MKNYGKHFRTYTWSPKMVLVVVISTIALLCSCALVNYSIYAFGQEHFDDNTNQESTDSNNQTGDLQENNSEDQDAASPSTLYETFNAMMDKEPPLTYRDIDSVASIDVNNNIPSNDVLPAKYDPFSGIGAAKYLTKVRNQNPYGTCWAHSAIGAIEAYLTKHNMADKNSLDLSERGLAYYFWNNKNVADPLNLITNDYNEHPVDDDATLASGPRGDTYVDSGGNSSFTMWSLAAWQGSSISEAQAPYSEIYWEPEIWNIDETNPGCWRVFMSQYDPSYDYPYWPFVNYKTWTKANAQYLNVLSTKNLNPATVPAFDVNPGAYHVQNIDILALKDRDSVKKAIYENGAVSSSYFHSTQYYNKSHNCYFQNQISGSNHAVCFVGWDDNFPKEYFNSNMQPQNNGAYLVRNSWGVNDYDLSGYFWISYEDLGINTDRAQVFAYDVEKYDPDNNENYARNYQYDGSAGLGITGTYPAGAANLFKVIESGDKAQTLDAVGVGTYTNNTTWKIEIYPNFDIKWISGKEGTNISTAGVTPIVINNVNIPNAGFHTIKLSDYLDEKIYLQNGKYFLVNFSSSGGNPLYTAPKSYEGSWYSFYNDPQPLQSFDCRGTNNFYDINNTVTAYPDDYTYRIKAYTNYAEAPDPEKIEIETPPAKTSYFAGDTFDPTGIKVNVVYPGNLKNDITNMCEFDKGVFEVGDTEVTVSYQYKSKTYVCKQAVTVREDKVEKIEVQTSPYKVSYYTDQSFDPTGMKVLATYTSGKTETATDYTWSPITPFTTPGIATVTISYAGKTTTLTVNVVQDTVKSLEITSPPTKNVYYEGEVFNPDGLKVNATYYSGKVVEDISGYTYDTNPLTTLGTNDFAITYNNKSVTTKITVKEDTIVSISTSGTFKTQYLVGDRFDPTGMIVKAKYASGIKADQVITGYTWNDDPFTEVGDDIKVTISYQVRDTTFTTDVSVKVSLDNLTGITIVSNPTKMSYYNGEYFDKTGMVVTASYQSGKTIDVSNVVTFNKDRVKKSLGSTTCKITLTYKDEALSQTAQATLQITGVKDAIAISGEITTYPTKRNYFVGESISEESLSEFEGNVIMSDDQEISILPGLHSPNVQVSPRTFTYATTWNVEVLWVQDGVEPLKIGEYTVTAQNNTVQKIELYQQPERNYYVGQTFDKEGWKLTATFKDGSTQIVDAMFRRPSTPFSSPGLTDVELGYQDSYGHQEWCSVQINVLEDVITSLEVTKLPTKLEYQLGNSFDPTGMEIIGTYASGKTEPITNYDWTPTTFTTEGEQVVTISVEGSSATTTVPVKVTPKVIKSIYTQGSFKTTYYTGQSFDPAGLQVWAKYTDSAYPDEQIMSGYTYDTNPFEHAGDPYHFEIKYSGFTTIVDLTVIQDAVSQLIIVQAPTKLDYYVSDAFEPDGMVLSATYLSGVTKQVTSGYTCVPPYFEVGGTQNVTIIYGGKEAYQPVNVSDPFLSMDVEDPGKTEYYLGEDLNTDDLKLVGYRVSSIEPEEISKEDCIITPTKLDTLGTTTISITYTGELYYGIEVTASYDVTVLDYVTKLDITQKPDNLNYKVGQSLDKEGMNVVVTYKSNTTRNVTDYIVSPQTFDVPGEAVPVTISYPVYEDPAKEEKVTGTFNVKVDNVLTGISVDTSACKMVYEIADSFNPAGLKVYANYVYGDPVEISEYFITPDEFTTAGNVDVTISYQSFSKTFKVEVLKHATSIEVVNYPAKTTYLYGETFDKDKMSVMATFNDGSKETVSDFTYSNEPFDEIGDAIPFEIKFQEVSTTITLKVEDALDTISVVSQPAKTSYLIGEDFDITGMIVQANYLSLRTEKLSSEDYNWNPKKFETEGTQKVEITYEGKTAYTENITVSDAIEKIEVTAYPTKTEYEIGEDFDPRGMEVTAFYLSPREETIPYTLCTWTPVTFDEYGDNVPVKVSYQNFTCNIYVTVKDAVESLEIITPPDKTTYRLFEEFDPYHMEVSAHYKSGKNVLITNYDYDPHQFTSLSQNHVTISYFDASIDLPVVVENGIRSLSIKEPPTKTEYFIGDKFYTNGMVVWATYLDNTEGEITDYAVSPERFTEEGDQVPVTISADGKSVNYNVVVKDAVKDIEVTKQPVKTQYYVEDSFDRTGMEVTAHYLSNKSQVVTDYQTSPDNFDTEGAIDVEVMYEGHTAKITVEVLPKIAPPEVYKIEVTKAPTKTNYIIGEFFDNTGMVVSTVDTAGNLVPVTGYTWAPTKFEELGDKIPVTITYTTQENTTYQTSTNVSVTNPIQKLEITTQPQKKNYLIHQSFDPFGMVVQATYANGDVVEVTDYEVSPESFESVGQVDVEISYEGKTATCLVIVSDIYVTLTIKHLPDQLTYYYGESLNTDGMKVEATTFNGDIVNLPAEALTINPDKFEALGEVDVTVSVPVTPGSSDVVEAQPFKVNVIDGIDYITATNPDRTEYNVGQSFDPTGMIVTAYYLSGYHEDVSDYSVSPSTFTEVVDKVTVTYMGKTCDVSVTVHEQVVEKIFKIGITHMPNKTSYLVGQPFVSNGLEVSAYYMSGNVTKLDSYAISTPSTETAGIKNVEVSYTEDGETFTTSFDIEVLDPMQNIEVTTAPTKTQYLIGETFDTAGMVVTAHYYSGKTDAITDYTFTPQTFTTEGESVQVEISSGNCKCYTSVSVKNYAKSIELTNPPTKLEYECGQVFDPTGLEVKVTYADGSVKEHVTSADTKLQYPRDPLYTPGTNTLTIKYVDVKEPAITLDIDVKCSLQSLIITGAKTQYEYGESFDPTGMTVKAHYSNAGVEDKDVTEKAVIETTGMLPYGQSQVTISYTEYGVKVQNTITVTTKAVLDKIVVEDQPTKKVYEVGESFDDTGMCVKAYYKLNPIVPVDVTSQLVYGSTNFNSVGDNVYIEFSYTEDGVTKENSVGVKVYDVIDSITITKTPVKLTYEYGDRFDDDGLEVVLSYQGGTHEKIVTDDVTCDTTEPFTTVGDNVEVKFSYSEENIPGKPHTVYAIQNVKVYDRIEEINIVNEPSVKTYEYGQTFDRTGMKVMATYYGSTADKDITGLVSYTSALTVVANPYPLEIKYTEENIPGIIHDFSVTQNITVLDYVDSISVTGPSKTVYEVGQEFDKESVSVTETYASGATRQIGSNEFSVNPPTLSTVGDDIEVEISYTETVLQTRTKTSSVYVDVKDYLDSIVVKTMPTKTVYNYGESFDPTGLTLTATSKTGDTKTITDGFTWSPTGPLTEPGTNVITVSYTEASVTSHTATVTLEVQVDDTFESISITNPPTKTEYYADEVFDPTGMVVQANFGSGHSKVVTNYTYNTDPLTVADTYVTISYTESSVTKTANQPINVRANFAITYDLPAGASNPNQVSYNPNMPDIELQPAYLSDHVFLGWLDITECGDVEHSDGAKLNVIYTDRAEDIHLAGVFANASGETETIIPVEKIGDGQINLRVTAKLVLDCQDIDSLKLEYKNLIAESEEWNEIVNKIATDNDFIGMFDLNFLINDAEVHNNFGTMNVEVWIDGDYDGTNVKLHHIHNDDSITSETTVIKDCMLNTNVVDLSKFAIENLDTQHGEDIPEFISATGDFTIVLVVALISIIAVAALSLRRYLVTNWA